MARIEDAVREAVSKCVTEVIRARESARRSPLGEGEQAALGEQIEGLVRHWITADAPDRSMEEVWDWLLDQLRRFGLSEGAEVPASELKKAAASELAPHQLAVITDALQALVEEGVLHQVGGKAVLTGYGAELVS